MLTLLALLAVLLIGIVLGLRYQGALWLGDRRILLVLAAELQAESEMRARTRATLQAMQAAARERP